MYHVAVVQQVGLYRHSHHTQRSAPLCGYLLLISYSGAASCVCQLSVCQRAGQEGSFAFVDTQGQEVDGSVCSQAWSEVRVCHCQHLLPTRGRPRGTDQAAAVSLSHTHTSTHTGPAPKNWEGTCFLLLLEFSSQLLDCDTEVGTCIYLTENTVITVTL